MMVSLLRLLLESGMGLQLWKVDGTRDMTIQILLVPTHSCLFFIHRSALFSLLDPSFLRIDLPGIVPDLIKPLGSARRVTVY